ncbi:MAG: hypothetical protein ACR2PW_04805 [Gammaproteobacteria bacterium]
MANETRSEQEKPVPTRFWEQQLALADKEEREWRETAQKVIDQYRSEKKGSSQKFNILWSNTETLAASIGGEDPQPDVRRRFKQEDPAARQVSEVLERAISYSADDVYDLEGELDATKLDMLLAGRGIVRIVYDPTLGEREVPAVSELGFMQIDDDGNIATEPQEFMADQEVRLEHVVWDDYRQSPSKSQKQVWWRAFRHKMTRDDLVDNFGSDIGNEVPLTLNPDGLEEDGFDKTPHSSLGRAEVWEIWDKQKRRVYFFAKGFPKFLADREDPLGLKNFFPVPEPAYGVRTPGTEIPVPEYTLYQSLADEANRLSVRIEKIVESIKRRGVYDAQFKDFLSKLVNGKDNDFQPVPMWAELQQKGGLAAVMQAEDYAPAIQALTALYQERASVIQQIFEITGISDVIRGSSDPRETARAQTIKAQFGSMRLQARQRRWSKMIRDAFRVKAEIIAEHFTPNILQRITGLQVTDDMIQIMRDDKLRGYKIDVETDQTAFQDDVAERQSRAEFTRLFIDLMKEVVPAVQGNPELAKMAAEIVMFNVRAFKAGREMEETIEEAMNALQNQPQQPPPPDPKMEKVKGDLQLGMFKLQQDGQLKQAEMTQDAQQAQLEMATEAQLETLKIQIEAVLAERKQDLDAQARTLQ